MSPISLIRPISLINNPCVRGFEDENDEGDYGVARTMKIKLRQARLPLSAGIDRNCSSRAQQTRRG
jgi:hypothetical protein